MDATLPLVLTGGLASGINAYLVVLLTGLLGRFGGIEGVPDALERTDVLVAAGLKSRAQASTTTVSPGGSFAGSIFSVQRSRVSPCKPGGPA